MRLVIGGFRQGKLKYVKSKYGFCNDDIAFNFKDAKNKPVFYGFHDAVKAIIETGGDPFSETKCLIAANPDITVICNELGCGVVPVMPDEREWREVTGRICCSLAKDAESVVRIFCGIPSVLKGQ